MSAVPDAAIQGFLRDAGLVGAGEAARYVALTGGVSSDIWLVETTERRFCVKRALAKLRVAADWRAPVERNVYEVEWLTGAGRAMPGAVPRVLASDPQAGMLAMDYLPPENHRLWKAELLAGRSDPDFAAAVGRALGRIHAAFARDPAARETFPRDDIFHAIRLEPYLEATGRAHPALAAPLQALVGRTAATKLTVVHGDISPKNILIGPEGPVFLDAECAWFGDPAFDPAFCLNHLLLKCIASPQAAEAHLAGFDALAQAYLAEADWEARDGLEARIASLLPGLFLARVDGKSPAEYVTAEDDKAAVRRVAVPLIATPPTRLAQVLRAWANELDTRGRQR